MLLINKESSSSKPVVFPVPPPDDLLQPPSQSAVPLTPPKHSVDPQRLQESGEPAQSQSLPQTPVTGTPTGGYRTSSSSQELSGKSI